MNKLFLLIFLLPMLAAAATSGDLGGGIPASSIGAPNGVASLDGTGKVPLAQIPGGGGGSSTWGAITGTLSDQTDLQSALNAKQTIFSGTTSQYVRGNSTLATLNTTVVPEGTNLYYTDVRAQASITGTAPIAVTAGVVSLNDTAVTPGSYTNANITVDAKGRLTAAANGSPGGVTSVTGTAPVVSSGGSTPAISMPVSTNSVDGYLSGADHTTFAAKEPAITATTSADYYRGDKTFQTLNSAAVPELTNLYYTDARARASISASAPLSYNSGTGALTFPFPLVVPVPGTAGIPTIQFDSDTGIYSTGDGQLNFSTNAVEALHIDDSGNAFFRGAISASNYPVIGTANTIQAFDSTGASVSLPTWTTQDVTGNISHGVTVVAADGVNVTGLSQSINVNPPADVTNATSTGIANTLVFDSANAGFGNNGGNYSSLYSRFEHNGSGHLAGTAEAVTASANFTNAGHLDTFKGVDMNAGVASGYTIGSYNGLFSTMNSTGGIFGGITMVGGGAGLTDVSVTGGSITASNFNMNIDGASVLSQGVTSEANTVNFGGTSTAVGTIQGNASGITIHDTAAANGGMTGSSANIQVNDAATAGHVNVLESDFGASGTSATAGVTAHQIGLNFSGSASGQNSNGINNGLNMSGASTLDSFTLFNGGVTIANTASITNNVNLLALGANFTGSGTASSVNGISMPMTVGGSTALGGVFEGIFTNQVLNGSATAPSLFGGELNIVTDNTAAVAGQIAGLKVNIQNNGTAHNGTLEGIEINLGGAHLSAGQLASGQQKVGLNINDGAINAGYNYTIPASSFFFQTHSIGGQALVDSGSPTAAFGFGANLAQSVGFADDWTADGTGLHLGFVNVGFVGNIQGTAGKTMDSWTGALAGSSNPGGAGTLDQAIMFRAAGILPQGGSLAVNHSYGFYGMSTLCLVAADCWGVYIEDALARNYFAGTVEVDKEIVAKQIATPANPAANHNKLYFKSDNNLYMKNSAGTETQVNGSGGGSPRTTNTVAIDTTIPTLTGDYIENADSTAGAVVITLPDAVASAGWCADIKNIGSPANNVTIAGAGGQLVDGAASFILTDVNEGSHVCAVGGNWFIY